MDTIYSRPISLFSQKSLVVRSQQSQPSDVEKTMTSVIKAEMQLFANTDNRGRCLHLTSIPATSVEAAQRRQLALRHTMICDIVSVHSPAAATLNSLLIALNISGFCNSFARCVSTKLQVSMAFLFRENRRHGMDGRTDRRTGCNG